MSTTTFFLQKEPPEFLRAQTLEVFASLDLAQRNCVYGKVYELAKMEDARIHGYQWGQVHVLDDIPRLNVALHRLGFFARGNVVKTEYHGRGAGVSYFNLAERTSEFAQGRIGYINGESCTIEEAGSDTARLSSLFGENLRIYCVHHSRTSDEPTAFSVAYVITERGRTYSKTSCLAAQQMIDYLDANPGKKFLQTAHKEGAVHTLAALRLIQEHRPELFPRIRVLLFAPLICINWSCFATTGLQVINLHIFDRDSVKTVGYHAIPLIRRTTTSGSYLPLSSALPSTAFPEFLMEAGVKYVDQFKISGALYDS